MIHAILSPKEGDNQQKKVPASDSIVPSMSFSIISLGAAVNAQGQIEHSKTVFKPDLKDLYFDIEIEASRKDIGFYPFLWHKQ